MNYKIVYLFVCFFALSISLSNAQQKTQSSLKLVKYKDNVNAPLTNKERNMLEEVYADKLEQYVLNRPSRLKDFKHLLRNRIEIKLMPHLVEYTKKYKTLSEAGLFNSYNKNLKFDTSYNPENFNPLKYNMEFYGKGSRIYRIDNTNYFVIIKSQQQ